MEKIYFLEHRFHQKIIKQKPKVKIISKKSSKSPVDRQLYKRGKLKF